MSKKHKSSTNGNIMASSRSFPLRDRLILKKMFVPILYFLTLLFFLFGIYETINDEFVIYSSIGAFILLFIAFFQRMSLRVFYYEIEDHFIIIKRFILVPKEITIEYSRMKEVVVFRDVFDRMFGLYQLRFHIDLTSSYGAKMAYIEGLDEVEAHELKVVIDKMVEKSRKAVR